jgi:hypothetical protein
MAPTTAAHRLSGGSPIPEQDEFVAKILRIIFLLFLILEGTSVRDPRHFGTVRIRIRTYYKRIRMRIRIKSS